MPPELTPLVTQFDIGEALKKLAIEQRITIRGTFRSYGPGDRNWEFTVSKNGEWTIW